MGNTPKTSTATTLTALEDLVKALWNMLSFDSETQNIIKFHQKNFESDQKRISSFLRKNAPPPVRGGGPSMLMT